MENTKPTPPMTRERLVELIDSAPRDYDEKGVDSKFEGIALLRQRVPIEDCQCIIGASEHDVIYLCAIDDALPNLSEEDATKLGSCGIHIAEEFECFALFT